MFYQGRKVLQDFCGYDKEIWLQQANILESKQEVQDYWECNIKGTAEDRESKEHVYTVNGEKMKKKQGEQ